MSVDLDLGDTRRIMDVARSLGVLRNQLAYILSTAYWETARTMKPVEEAYWLPNAEAWRKANLRYWPWHGRGYVQLTWEAGYVKAGRKLGLNLTKDPSVAMQPSVASRILVVGMIEGWFTGKKLSDYITLSRSDFVGARRIINGIDKRHEIAAIARDYDEALKRAGYGMSDTPAWKPRIRPLARPVAATGSFFAALAAFIKGTPQ